MTADPIDVAEIAQRLENLCRGTPEELTAYFEHLWSDPQVAGTRTRVRCSTLRCDRRGPRVKDLAAKLRNYVVDFAVPRSRISEAFEAYTRHKSAAAVTHLYAEASRLFTRILNSGEGGELMLYALTEKLLGIPQIMCKMPLKTSAQVHVHGTDGIHAAVSPETGRLALYWGESKLHEHPSTAIDACFDSLVPFLLSDGGSDATAERDLQLLRANIDLSDPELEAALLAYLDPDNPQFLTVDYRAACLVGFNEKAYRHLPARVVDFASEIEAGVLRWRKKVNETVTRHKVQHVDIELFCVPLPSVQDFRDALRDELSG